MTARDCDRACGCKAEVERLREENELLRNSLNDCRDPGGHFYPCSLNEECEMGCARIVRELGLDADRDREVEGE